MKINVNILYVDTKECTVHLSEQLITDASNLVLLIIKQLVFHKTLLITLGSIFVPT